MATHSSILAWKIPWTEESGRLQSMGLQRFRHNWANGQTHTHTHTHTHFKDHCFLERLYQLFVLSLVAQRLKRPPAMRETRVWFLDREDPLEKEMATHSSILTWRIPWMEEPGGLQSTGSQRFGHDWATSLSLSLSLCWLSKYRLLIRMLVI